MDGMARYNRSFKGTFIVNKNHLFLMAFATLFVSGVNLPLMAQEKDSDDKTLRVFIFAGQSNMVGSDSKVKDIKRFPPFTGLDMPQEKVLYSYNLGRENKVVSNGWVALKPVDNVVGPELSFARKVSQEIKAPIAIIKCAAGWRLEPR
jgi:hypothetical protein